MDRMKGAKLMQMQSRIDIRQQHARQQDKRFALVKSRFQSQMQSRPKFVRQVAARSLNEHLVWNNKYIQELGASGEPLISSALKFPELCDIGSRMTAGDTVLAVLPKEPSRVERERERAAVGRSPAVAVPATEVQQCIEGTGFFDRPRFADVRVGRFVGLTSSPAPSCTVAPVYKRLLTEAQRNAATGKPRPVAPVPRSRSALDGLSNAGQAVKRQELREFEHTIFGEKQRIVSLWRQTHGSRADLALSQLLSDMLRTEAAVTAAGAQVPCEAQVPAILSQKISHKTWAGERF